MLSDIKNSTFKKSKEYKLDGKSNDSYSTEHQDSGMFIHPSFNKYLLDR